MMRRLLLGGALAVLMAGLTAGCGTNLPRPATTSPSPSHAGTKTAADANASSASPARPAASYIVASAVHGVVVTAVSGVDRDKPPAPLIITDPATIGRLVALVNGLSPFPPGVYSCPADDGAGVQLTYVSKVGAGKAGAPITKSLVLAVALAKSAGCGGVQLTIDGTRTSLGWGPGAAQQALAISGMHWKPTMS
jgi:hypothetical protein